MLDPQDVEYESSKCKTPHSDGSTCIPEWDGYGFVCPYYVIERTRHGIVQREPAEKIARRSFSKSFGVEFV